MGAWQAGVLPEAGRMGAIMRSRLTKIALNYIIRRNAVLRFNKCANKTVVGVNLCIRSNPQQGALLVWNKRPDEEERLRLGVEHLGYPYPSSFVKDHEYLRILPEPGDIYCVNGTLLHAVEKQQTGETRLSLSFIIGFIDDATVVYWT